MRYGHAIVATALGTALALSASQGLAVSSRTLIAPTGEAAGDLLGISVGSAGDVNGDGYADVIVGAQFNNTGGIHAGRAYVYFGGPGGDALPDVTLTGGSTFGSFGYCVGTAGDVNGDGFADVVVGAPNDNAGGSGAGRAYVYFGGPIADAVADLTLTGAAFRDYFGTSVGTAGDVNGDGFADVIVGAPFNGDGGIEAGRAYVYFGGPGADATADLVLTGTAALDHFGHCVGTAGDVNGDGFADIIVGAPDNDAGGTDAGRAYVYFGGPGADTAPDLTLTNSTTYDKLGDSVGTAGDVNGDGFADVIVGAIDADVTNAGRAYVYFGGPEADAAPDLTLTGAAAYDEFGYCVGTAGDANGDGYADVIVGARLNNAAGVDAGRIYVYFGGPGADSAPDLILTGAAALDHFGESVGTAGDVNGDGFADLIVGAPSNDAGGESNGSASVVSVFPYQVLSPNGSEQWVVGDPATIRWLGSDVADISISTNGGLTFNTVVSGVGGAKENSWKLTVPSEPTNYAKIRLTYSSQSAAHSNSDASDATFRIVAPTTPRPVAAQARITMRGAAPSDGLGTCVAAAGDVNRDGYPDWIVGAPFNSASGTYAGAAYVYNGGPAADLVPDWTLTGAAAGDNFGQSVSAAGDVNGDGYADLIVGAPGNGAAGEDAGAAYVFYGGPVPDAVPDLVLTGATTGELLGNSVAGAGDVNGDGYADLIVSAHVNDQGGVDAGRAYVFFGGPYADNAPDIVLTGEAAGDLLGVSVAGLGDVNRDGFDDVIVGAILNDAGGVDAGRAYVYFGGPAADNVADLVLTGASAGDVFGAVASAGDMNGDGFGDIVVGAGGNDAGGMNAGRAYVYYGGPMMDASPDLVLTGAAANEHFGTGTSAGDANGDGFGDLIVGAWGSHAGGTRAGRAYVYYGGTSPDAIADLIMTGAAAEDFFGISVGAVGDVDGDGFTDVIVGASGSDVSGNNAGAAYLYDMKRYHVLSPNGGETWNVGASKTISWLGAEPANVWLSTDAGKSYDLLGSGIGGAERNDWALRVPHAPGKFTMVKIAPTDPSVRGFDRSDSMFTIQTSVSLLALLAAPAPDRPGAAVITWNTDPGPADLAGYKLEKGSEAGVWRTLVALTKGTSYTDESAALGAIYRLFAVNGLGEELWLGETSVRPVRPLAAWPLPYRGGDLNVSFATYGGLGGGAGRAEVSVYDVQGRLVRRVAHGAYAAGYQMAVWDGRNERGVRVAAGVYLLRVQSEAGAGRTLKLAVLR